nr:uncharacterized protein LOC129267344 [Lytechinus pictus]
MYEDVANFCRSCDVCQKTVSKGRVPKTTLVEWQGAFKVVGTKFDYDYVVDVNGVRKTYHINLLRRYVRREEEVAASCFDVGTFNVKDKEEGEMIDECIEMRLICHAHYKRSLFDAMNAVRRFVSVVVLGGVASMLLLFLVSNIPTKFILPRHSDANGEARFTAYSANQGRTARGSLRYPDNVTVSLAHSAEHVVAGASNQTKTSFDFFFSANTSTQPSSVGEFEKEKLGGMTSADTISPSGQERHDETRCVPRENIMYLKTHKTGSSTLQNIIYRYGDAHGLTFALPKTGVHLGTPSLFNRTHPVKSPSGKYNILANHARYNRPGE